MEFSQYVRRPFKVDAIEITADNIDEIADLGLGEVRESEKDGKPYISLNRRVVPNVARAYLGWWITKMDDNYRCYSPKAFKAQYLPQETVARAAHKDESPAEPVVARENTEADAEPVNA